ncbi:MAG: 5'-methylthioadenosine/adenosylhomocysteine nucleosidase [Prevotella sp.]|jgi:adenosylhomocysteine nucleosidase
MNYNRIAIIVAMDKEFNQLESLLSNKQTREIGHGKLVVGQMGNKEIALQKCGIGKVNSAIGATLLIQSFHPDLIISSGCAGGADTKLSVGDVVVAKQCTYHDAYCGDNCEKGQILGMPARYDAPAELVETALSLNSETTTVKAGLTVSGEWFVDSREKMRSILDQFPKAEAVDMESCSIAQTCHIFGVPFISFRIISDVPLNDHKAQMYFDFWDRMANGSFEVTKKFLNRI